MSRLTFVFLLLSLPLTPLLAESETQTYEKIARAPTAYAQESYLRFTMQFNGLQDVAKAFAPIGRNSTSHVQFNVRKPRGARQQLPVFMRKSKSYLLRKLRNAPDGTTFLFRGRVRYFKVPVYNAQSFLNAKAPGVKVTQSQSRGFAGAFGGQNTKVETTKGEAPKAAGQATYYILDILSVKNYKPKNQPSTAKTAKKGAGYQQVRPVAMAANPKSFISKPVKFNMPYNGQLGKLMEQANGQQMSQAFALPKYSAIQGGNLGKITDPTAGMQVLRPPGPLGKLITISFGKDWDLKADLAKAEKGDTLEVSGVLYPGGEKAGSKFIFVLEGVTVVRKKPAMLKRPKRPKPPFGPGGRR